MKKKALAAVIICIVALMAVVLSACTSATVVLDLNGGIYNGTDEALVVEAGGTLYLGDFKPEKEDAVISGWVDEEGNFYGADSYIVPVNGSTLTAVYEGVLKYTRVEDGYAVSATEGYSAENVVIPSEYDGLPVTEVAAGAFANCTSMRTLRIPDSVVRIGRGALSGCTSLESIILPFVGPTADVSVGTNNNGMAYVFGLSSGSSWATFPNLTQITVTDAAVSLPNGAFENMTSLRYVNVGSNVTALGARAFSGCSNLASVILPEGCTSIGERAFANCSKAAITVKGAVTSLGANAFYNSGITSITLGEGLSSIPAGCFEGSSLTSIVLPSSVTSINSAAFRNCSRLTKVEVNASVTLYSSAFNGCANLTDAGLVFGSGGEFTFAEGARENAFGGTKVTIYNN